MQQAAAADGIELALVSSYRSFAQQARIWTAKYTGQRPVYNKAQQQVDISQLDGFAKIEAILLYSALPGASRHHWGTDLDVFDKAAVAADYQVQLLDAEYQQSVKAAELVSSRINKVESVADALFNEWQDELGQYQNASLKAQSKQKLVTTEKQFDVLLKKMRSAEKKMQPVLKIMHDNVLFLKHNLNAKAIGSIQTDFAGLQQDVSSLISEMNKAIADSNKFIAQMQTE